MSINFEEYLNQATQKLKEVLSDPNIDEKEREAITAVFYHELEKGIGDSEAVADYEKLIYGTSMQYIDKR